MGIKKVLSGDEKFNERGNVEVSHKTWSKNTDWEAYETHLNPHYDRVKM